MKEDFFKELDLVFKKHNIEETKQFLERNLETAVAFKNTGLILTVLNELIGFYRDISDFEASMKYAESLNRLIDRLSIEPDSLFICYINIGNAMRAGGKLSEAGKYFDKAIRLYDENGLACSAELAALYNNYALVYEELEDYSTAIRLLDKALSALGSQDEIKTATTYVNMAMNWLSLSDFPKAKRCLEQAKPVFLRHTEDFHYSGYAACWAKYYYGIKNYELSKDFYEEACCKLLKTVGRNTQYQQIWKELLEVYDILGIPPHIKGLKLSYSYFKAYQKELFDAIDAKLKATLTIGLFGLGSECFGMDDVLSEDHDFEPGFIILTEDTISEAEFNQIQTAYLSLPQEWNRYYISRLSKHGVHRFSEYLRNYLGVEDITRIPEESKPLITNGEIFYGKNTSFIKLREQLKEDLKYSFIPNIILKTLEISQYIPYNLTRVKSRGDNLSYELLRHHLMDKIIEYAFIYNRVYLVHDKLRIPILRKMENPNFIRFTEAICQNRLDSLFQEIPEFLIQTLWDYNCIKTRHSEVVEDYREELIQEIREYAKKKAFIEEIINIEWNMFTVLDNIGGRASCQDNYSYFKLMREAQYYTWSLELVASYLQDLKQAEENGYNLLAMKYGYMEESTDYEHYVSIRSQLPVLSERRKALQEEIIRIQTEQMNEFSKNHFEEASRMRSIYTSEDTIQNTSYETYLRGEISTYSEQTLVFYGKMIAEYEKSGKNIIECIIRYTYLFR